MANHKSALKKYIRDEKRRMINRMNRSKMKTRIKSFIKKLETHEMEDAKTLYPQLVSVIDKSVSKGTIHKKPVPGINTPHPSRQEIGIGYITGPLYI